MPQKVLIVSHLFEPSVNAVIEHLDQMGVEWFRLNCEEFPLLSGGRTSLTSVSTEATIATPNGLLRAHEIGAVWFRRAAKPALPISLRQKDRDFARNECSSFLGGFFDLLDAHWMNDRDAERRASSKIHQLNVASSIGFCIPKTLVTNQTEQLKAFVDSVDGDVIFKPVSGYAPRGADFSSELQSRLPDGCLIEIESGDSDDAEIVFAQLLTPEKLVQISALQLSPVIFQEFIRKVSDVRVTIVGSEIFSCRIRSQDLPETQVDFRRMALLDSSEALVHEPHKLPPDVEGKCRLLMNRLGLLFGCIDLVETQAGDYVFLEVNPSGQWLWIEHRIGAQVSLAVARELARMASCRPTSRSSGRTYRCAAEL